MPTKTRGNLAAAQICEVTEKGTRKEPGLKVLCMFNPYEYRITKTNSFNQKPKNDADVTQAEFQSAGPQTLTLSLYFDTYEENKDVSQTTRELWKFMQTKGQKKSKKGKKVPPPQVAFEWGVFFFVAYITNMTQTFTLFKDDGTPVRAKVDVTFTQYVDVDDYPSQKKGPGTFYEQAWRVIAGDRLDTIAGEVYGDPEKWRLIAERNHITNPRALRPGQILQIPIE
jgi:nucleoid-associated protein YgaU